MWRKVTIVALGVIVAAAVLSYTKLGSYAGTAWGKFRTTASNQVPVDFEINRLEHEVEQLVSDIKKQNRDVIAPERVAIDNLREDIAATRTKLDEQRNVLLQLQKDLDSGETTFIYAGVSYKRERILEKLARDFESYKRAEAGLTAKQQLLESKEQALAAAKEQLEVIRQQRDELKAQIEQLKAEAMNVKLAQSRCKVQVDDSRLADIKKSMNDLRNRLKADRIAAEMEGEFANDPIPVGKKVRPASEVTREVREYFGGKNADGKVAIE